MPSRLAPSRVFRVTAVAIRRAKAKALVATGLLAVGLIIGSASLSGPAVAATGINKTINFQGKVVNSNGTNVSNGSYTFVFKLYSVATGGTAIWTESKSLTVTDGVFQTNLGDATSLPGSVDFNTDNIYMGITFAADAEMSPRIQFTAAAYAFNSDRLGGIQASGFAQLNPASAQSGSLNVTGSLQAATSLQAPLIDTATATTLNIGTGTASAVNIGKNGGTVTIQGNASSSWKVITGSFNTTVSFATPTANNAITFPDAGGTVCTTVASTCSATYQAASATGYLMKNAADTSSASTLGSLLGLTNTNSGAAGVLSLTNAGTNAALSVFQSGNPINGQALILANNTNGAPTGNLIDLQVGGTSKFSVNTSGNAAIAGTITSGTVNGQTISSAAGFTGTVTVGTGLTVTSGGINNTAGGITNTGAIAGATNIGLNGTISGGTTYTASSAVQAPSFDTASAAALNIGTGTASSVTIGRATSSNAVSVQGSAASTWLVTGASGTSTLAFAAPSGATITTISAAGGTVCTTVASTCNSVYQPISAGGYLLKNAADTSSASVAGTLLGLTNTNTGAANVLSLTGSGTGSALSVTQSGNPSAGQALIVANNSNGTPSGNLMDLQQGGTSRFSVNYQGNATGGTYNAQTISSAASFTGTVTVATSITAPLLKTADSASASTSALVVRSGAVSGGSGLTTGSLTLKSGDGTGTNTGTGNVTLDTGAKSGSGFAGNLNIGTANTSTITIGRNGATPAAVNIQGLATSSSMVMSNSAGTFSSTINFANPTATTTTTFSNAGGTVCTTVSTTCSATYQAAGSYLLKNAADTSSAGVAGYLLGLTNTSGNVLQLTGAGTGSALSVSQSGNPAAGSAVIYATNTNGTPTGNLIDLQAGGSSKFSVTAAGALATAGTINNQTISSTANFTGTVTSANAVTVSSGGIAVTGNSNITGTLGVTSNVTVSAGNLTLSNGTLSVTSAVQNSITGGLSLSGGLANNNAGITATGAVAGATTVTASGTITGGGAFRSADGTTSSAVTLMSGNASAGASGNVSIDAGTATTTAGTLNLGTSNASAINVGNSTATAIVQGGSASKFVFGNTTVNAASSATAATYQFAAPSSATTYTICTTDSASCSGAYLRKNVAGEQSSAGLSSGQYLYNFANTGASTADVLQLNSGTGTGSALKVTAAANASTNNALIFAKLTNASVGGNLIDLWSGATGVETSKFAVAASGAVTSGTINGQTLGATSQLAIVNTSGLLTANSLSVTGTASVTGSLAVTGVLNANGGANVTGGINNNAGGITAAGAVSGLTSLQFNTAGSIDTNSAVAITIGTSTASGVTVGRSAGSLALQGASSSFTMTATNSSFTTTVGFVNPTSTAVYQFANPTTGTYQICSTYASTCGTTYAPYYASGYIQLAPGTAQADTSSNTSIYINKTTGTNLVNLQASSSTVFSVQTNGNFTSTGTGTLGNGVATVDATNFKVRIGNGSPTQGAGTLGNAGLYVTGTTELNGLVLVGDTTNNATFNAGTKEVTFNGTARHTMRVQLNPEYPGAVMSANATSGTTGSMTSDFCAAANLTNLTIPTTVSFCPTNGDYHNYYKWNAANASSQTYDIYVNYTMPSDFSAFSSDSSINMYGYRTGSSDNVQLAMFGANGTQCGSTTSVSTSNTAWTETALGGTETTCSVAAGDRVTFRVRLTSTSTSNSALAGEIRFDYLSKY